MIQNRHLKVHLQTLNEHLNSLIQEREREFEIEIIKNKL